MNKKSTQIKLVAFAICAFFVLSFTVQAQVIVNNMTNLHDRLDEFNTGSANMTIEISNNFSITELLSVHNPGYTLTITSGAGPAYKLTRDIAGDLFTVTGNSALTLENIIIDGNIATPAYASGITNGSLVHVGVNSLQGTLNLLADAVLQNNFYNVNGAGVYIDSAGIFNMSGGLITGNKANGSAGGVYIQIHGGTFNMSGGEISGNYCGTSAASYAGGVHFPGGSGGGNVFNLGGTAVIKDNYKGVKQNNVYVGSGRYITLGTGSPIPAPAATMKVYITKSANSGVFVNSGGDGYLSNFFADDISCMVVNLSPKLQITCDFEITISPYLVTLYDVATVGYAPRTPQTITVTNTGIGPTGPLAITLSGENAADFTLNKTSISNINPGVGEDSTFTVVPNTGLAVGTYNAFVIVGAKAGSLLTRRVDFSFTVEPKPFCGGDGTTGNPYQICNARQLDSVRYFLDKNFILNNDININDGTIPLTSAGWMPIGDNTTNTDATRFTGTLNGKGFKVYNLHINRPSTGYVGLFGYFSGSSAKIDSLGVEIAVGDSVKGQNDVGGLAGRNSASISNCYVSGNVKGNSYIGGLVGRNANIISNCYATGSVSGNSNVGGLAGYNTGGATIINCYAVENVRGSNYVGGLLGYNTGSTVSNCYATGNVSGTGATAYVGGLVGTNATASSISNCVAANDSVTGMNAFRIARTLSSTITNCYALDTMKVNNVNASTNIAHNDLNGADKTLEDLKTFTFYDVTATWTIAAAADPSKAWRICPNNSILPYLQWEQGKICPAAAPYNFCGGTGTLTDPYQICTAEQLDSVRYFLDQHFVLNNNIDISDLTLTSAGWNPIGTSATPFTGTLNGAGHRVYNLWINRPAMDTVGLFGKISEAKIDSLGVEVTASGIKGHDAVGVLAGAICNGSTVFSCYATGNVSGNDCIGGLVAHSREASIISNCYATGNVTSNASWAPTGGVLGDNWSGSIVEYCYATGNISGMVINTALIGGVVGYNRDATVRNCVAANGTLTASMSPNVKRVVGYYFSGTMSNNYASQSVLVNGSPVGGTPAANSENGETKTTSDVLTLAFYNTGSTWFGGTAWDMEDAANTSKTWRICPAGSLPFFQWEQGKICPAIASLFCGGDGTPGNPYQICTARQLDSVRYFLDSNFILNNDIDINDGTVLLGSGGWLPIGDNTTPFEGTLNGAGHKITNLWINSMLYAVGLFGVMDGATIDSLGLQSVEITGANRVGGLVGVANNATISNSYVTGKIHGMYDYSGGLVGMSAHSTIEKCYTTVSLTAGGWYSGGLVGYNDHTTISNCYATGNIGSVTAAVSSFVGGLVGYNSNSNIENSYAAGTVRGNASAGGLVGGNVSSNITNCVAANNFIWGDVLAIDLSRIAGNSTGASSLTNNYANEDMKINGAIVTTGTHSNVNGADKTLPDLKTFAFYNTPAANWTVWNIDENVNTSKIWRICPTGSLPYFQWQQGVSCAPPPSTMFCGGNGTLLNPYQICNAIQLDSVRLFLDQHFILMNDIDLATDPTFTLHPSFGWEPIGDAATPFEGTFNGAGNKITGLWINRVREMVGLFGVVHNAGIDSLGVEIDAKEIKGTNNVGGLAGFTNNSTIANSYTTGNINGNSGIGGLMGTDRNSTISNCYATGDINGSDSYVGGLVGVIGNTTSITNSHATGNVSGLDRIGGLFGGGTGLITNCYATGNVHGATGYSGGLAGEYGSVHGISVMENSYATGNVSGYFYLGGLVGEAYNSAYTTISNCYASGNVTGIQPASIITTSTSIEAGGLVGQNTAIIENCYATGNVSATGSHLFIAGLVAHNAGSITNCYATGKVDGTGIDNAYIGGLIAYNVNTTITNCVAANDSISGISPALNINRIVSFNGGTGVLINNYANKDMTVLANTSPSPIGTIGLTELAGEDETLTTFKTFAFYNDATPGVWSGGAWSIKDDVDLSKIWKICTTGSLPYFQWQSGVVCHQLFCGGSGTTADPYRICTAEQLDSVRYYLDQNFILMNDIDLDAFIATKYPTNGWLPIGDNTTNFTGTFNGQGNVITGLHINRPATNYVGLFGYISGSGAKIDSLGVEIAVGDSVKGYDNVGGLAGRHYNAIISNCYAIGNVSGTNSVGGLVGYNWGTISNCYATGNVSGINNSVGGLVGINTVTTISNCYATGKVSGNIGVGGLVGDNDLGTISNCVAANDSITGNATRTNRIVGINSGGTISNCYANSGMIINNLPFSGTAAHNNVNGADASLPSLKTFDFYNNTPTLPNWTAWSIAENADPSKVWRICPTGGFPYFQWQKGVVCDIVCDLIAPSATTPQTLCPGSTVSNLVATGLNIKWHDGLGNELSPSTALTDGETYFAFQSAGTCISADSTAVTVILKTTALPAPAILPNPQNLCGPATIADIVIPAGINNVVWYNASISGTQYSSTDPLTTGTYYAAIKTGSCESATRTAVIINIVPGTFPGAPSVTSPQNFCPGATVADIVLPNNQIAIYETSTSPTPLTPATTLASGTYYAKQKAGTCESTGSGGTTPIIVNVGTASAPTAPTPQYFCLSGKVADLAATGAGLVWYDSNTATVPLAWGDPLVTGEYFVGTTVCAGPRTKVDVITNYTIHASAGANGTISPNGAIPVNCGDNQNFTFTPNTGYHVDSVYIDGVFNAQAVEDGEYTFINVTKDATIHVTFARNSYTITAIATPDNRGFITPSGVITVFYGDDLSFTFGAKSLYLIDQVLIDGVNDPAAVLSLTYTFTFIEENHTIEVIFACPPICSDLINLDDYHVVDVAGLCWTKENLHAKLDPGGNPIAFAKPYEHLQYPDVTLNEDNFGLLYDWYSVMRITRSAIVQGICPDGWRLPTSAELLLLNIHPANELRNSTYWLSPGAGTNLSGFDARGAGFYNSAIDRFEDLYGYTFYWSSDALHTDATCNAGCLNYYCNKLEIVKIKLTDAASVRCVVED